ncbi:MAG: type II toxin-antitoxin system PemK/MazF family toxin [bacterium]|nr:type II toxin-antitoxin system PemK/MazF family toxin [bacterium]
MRKGHIVLIPFPFTDLSGKKVRPALVLYAGGGEDCVVAFITSAKASGGTYGVKAQADSKNGLKVDSIIRVDKIATLQKKIVIGELGTLDTHVLASVHSSLKKLFGI